MSNATWAVGLDISGIFEQSSSEGEGVTLELEGRWFKPLVTRPRWPWCQNLNKTLTNVGLVRLFGHCHLENGSCSSLKNANVGFQVVLEGKSSKERAIDIRVLQDSIPGSSYIPFISKIASIKNWIIRSYSKLSIIISFSKIKSDNLPLRVKR